MQNILNSISNSLNGNNYYAALTLALIIPDICSKLEEPKVATNIRYPLWFDRYMNYEQSMSGIDCYVLRCALLHEGVDDVSKQSKKDVLDKFLFLEQGSHRKKFVNCHFGDPRFDGKNFLVLSVENFCHDIMTGAEKWLLDVSKNHEVKARVEETITIHSGTVGIGGVSIS